MSKKKHLGKEAAPLRELPRVPFSEARGNFQCVGDLRQYMQAENLSPEALSELLPVSNMTWRRILQLDDQQCLDRKYATLLNTLLPISERNSLQKSHFNTEESIEQLVLSAYGHNQSELIRRLTREGDVLVGSPEVFSQVAKKSRSYSKFSRAPRAAQEKLQKLLKDFYRSPDLASKALILGTVLYFINPFDLVADALLGIGFLDDIGIFNIVAYRLAKK